MNTSTITPVSQTEIFFETSYGEIRSGTSFFLDIGPGKIGKDKKEYLGFPPIKVKRFGGTKFIKTPILVMRIANQEHFKPEISGERWKVVVKEIEITPQLTLNKAFQRVLIHIEAKERSENDFEYYDKKSRQYVVETRSGRVSVCRDVFETEEEEVSYREQQYLMKVLNVYARVNGSARQLIFQELIGGSSKSLLVKDRASEIAQKAFLHRRHGSTRDFRQQAEREIAEYFAELPEMPEKLRGIKK